MKESLRNLALSAAVLSAGAMFAQTPTVTVNFSQKITTAEIAALGGEVRVASGANGYVYALNKATGEVYAINGEGVKTLEKTFAPVLTNDADETIASLNTAITTDDAGNIIVLYANGSFWANGPRCLGIMPADGGEIIYTDALEFPEGYDAKRLDVLGRVAGNVLETGVLYFAPGNGASAVTTAGFVFEEGVPTAMEYCSTALTCGATNLNVAVPGYNSIDELMDVDAIYDAMYVQQYNDAASYFYVEDETAMKGAVPVPEGGAVGGAPAFDLINRDGEMYYFSMFRTPALNPGYNGNSRCANFQMTDAEGNVIFATENVAAEAGTTFINGAGLYVHQVTADKYEVYFWGGPKESVYATMATVDFGSDEPAYEAPVLGFRGAANDWGFGQVATVEGPDDNGLYTYTLELDELAAGEFKFGTDDWATSFGAGANRDLTNGTALEAWENSQANFNMPEDGVNVKLVLTVNPDYEQASSLLATWEVAAPVEPEVVRSAFAYALNAVKNQDNTYDITFKATGAGDASLVLTNANTEIVKTLGAAVKGENKFNVEFTDKEQGEFNWAVRIETENAATAPEFAAFEAVDNGSWARGGVVTINDPEYDSFGYTMIAAARNNGVAIYNPEGELVNTVYQNSVLNSPNSCPLHGGERFGMGVFASWADANSGYYYVDPLNPAETPENILVGDRAASGLFTYDGVQTAGGSPCVAFLGEGDDQTMWLYEEDLFINTVAIYPIGTAKQLTVAGTPLSWTKSPFASTAVCFTPTKYGMFGCQNRGNGMEEGVPAFIFMSPQGDRLINAVDLLPEGYTLPSSNGGLAVSNDGTLLAVTTYNSIEFFTMEWEEKTFPEYDNEGNLVAEKTFTVPCNLEFLYSIECKSTANLNFGQATFDAGNNLHYAASAGATNSAGNGLKNVVVTLPGANVATTPAKAESKIVVTTAVESIEAAAAADAVYYNLNGVRVAPENMTNGIYVKVQGDKAQKVVVK